jgi:Tol biopolymer transport system component
LTHNGDFDRNASWSPDGQRLVWEVGTSAKADSANGIWVMNADGTNPHKIPAPRTEWTYAYEPVWSPACNMIAYSGFDSTACAYTLWVVSVNGAARRRLTSAWSP